MVAIIYEEICDDEKDRQGVGDRIFAGGEGHLRRDTRRAARGDTKR